MAAAGGPAALRCEPVVSTAPEEGSAQIFATAAPPGVPPPDPVAALAAWRPSSSGPAGAAPAGVAAQRAAARLSAAAARSPPATQRAWF